MKRYGLLLFAALVAVSAVSCRKDAPEIPNPNEDVMSATYADVFKAFWHGMNNSYVFWDIDPTDWDAVYDEYLPKFEALDTMGTVRTGTLRTYYSALAADLVDHHLAIQILNPRPAESDDRVALIQPGYNEVLKRDYYHEPVSVDQIRSAQQANMQAGRISDFEECSIIYDAGDGENEFYASSYNIDNGIIYLYFTSFSMTEIFPLDTEGVVKKVFANYLDMVVSDPSVNGVIIDVRGNGGGYLADMKYVVSPLIDEVTTIGYSRSKNGPGRLDYDEWVPCVLYPAAQHRKLDAPIVVLADLWSVSMAEMTAMAVSALPNGAVVGERTFGGTGPLAGDYNLTYAGAFDNNVMSVYTSTSMLKDANGVIHEGVGIEPDIQSFYDVDAFAAGVDVQLEAAIKYVKGEL